MGRSLPRARLPAATAAAALLLALLACSCVHCQEEPAAVPAAAAPDAAATEAAVPDAAVPDAAVQMVSQAGCECLSTWYDAAGIERQGCANPDMDPMGDWCQVNPNTCLGYYGVYTSANGSDVFYDYCSAVREKTVGGCLCAPDWSMGPGATVGKPHYRDRCARPEAPDGEQQQQQQQQQQHGSSMEAAVVWLWCPRSQLQQCQLKQQQQQAKRKCRVDFATCPENSTVGEFDFCEDTPAAAAAAAAAGESERSVSTTFHNCDCKAGWIYTYVDGSKANFSACANPDGDPMGPWCAVDPATCDRFAGEIDGQERNETLGYDYCNNKFRHPEPNSCAAVLQEFDQCGGKSKCSDFGCEDEPWPGACCPQGTRCYRQDSFYYQCLSPYNVQRLKEQQAAAAAAGIAFAGLKPDTTAPLQQLPDQAGLLSQDLLPEEQQQAVVEEEQEDILTQEDPASLLPSPAQDASQSLNSAETQTQTQTQVADSANSLIPSPGQAGSGDSWRNSDGLTAPITLSPARQPTKVYTKLKIDMDYDKLVSSPENTARFKSDVVTWLKSSVGNTQNVQDAGVMAIVRGSVVALAYVEFKPDTPAQEIELATSHLRTNADRLYGASSLPSAWGGLVSYLVSPNAAALDGAAMEMVPQQRGKTGKLGSGAIAGIAVALVCAVALSAYVVKRTLGAKRRREAGEDASGNLEHSSKHFHQDMEIDGPVDGNSTYSSNGPADGSTYSSNESYAASPTKSNKSNKSNMSQGASPTRSAGFGRVGAWSDRSNSKSAEEVAYLDEEAEPVGLVVPASGASNLSTVAVHGSASAGSPQALAARAATPDAAFLPDECEHTFDEEELDLAKNPVGRLRAMYGQGQGRNSGTGTPGGNRNNGDSYTGSAASFHSLSSRPASGAGAATGAVLKQRRISSTSRSSDS
uniref:CBM1 domain-containing protein n=1 Tax=Tetradesmus obliquus TaxID=3088 RepID=A0A383VIB2_TETOB